VVSVVAVRVVWRFCAVCRASATRGVVIVVVVDVVAVVSFWRHGATPARRLLVADERDDVGQTEDEMTLAARQQIAAALHHAAGCTHTTLHGGDCPQPRRHFEHKDLSPWRWPRAALALA